MTISEEIRLAQDQNRTADWKRWGPYLSERQWGTVRESVSHRDLGDPVGRRMSREQFALGAFAIGSQVLFCIMATVAGYGLGWGLRSGQRKVVALGVCTRNLGAALAPLFSVAAVDERAIVMVALGVLLQTIAAVVTARWLGRTPPP